MDRIDALFLHAPRFDGERREVMVLPLGIPALANLLVDDGRTVEIVHLGIEPEVDRSFSLRALLQKLRPRMVLVSLHFNPQTRTAIDTVRAVRAYSPESRIVMGGLTATVFADELVGLGLADVVVRGDGEEPLRALARVLLDGQGSLADVPNLTYRDGDAVRATAKRWIVSPDVAAGLRHADLATLRHREAYVARSLYADFSEGAKGSEGYPYAAYINAGRGCTSDCACCGGSRSSQLVFAERVGLVLYPQDKLARDVRDAAAAGARVLRTCFDPPEARAHVLSWFSSIRADGIRMRGIYDFWVPPTRAFLAEFAKTFEPGSLAVLSPDCGSDAVRKRIRGYAFTNEQLLGAIHASEDAGIDVHCFFSAGLPGETPADLDETARLVERIRKETRSGISITPMFIDPGNAMWREPERFGIRLVRRTLRDFYEEAGIPGGPGFETEHFTEAQSLEACRRILQVAGIEAS